MTNACYRKSLGHVVTLAGIIALMVYVPTRAPVCAQSFNLDMDMPAEPPELGGGVPSEMFGGAADQPGEWNSIVSGSGPFPLVDLGGAKTTATVSVSSPDGFSFLGFNNPDNTGDFALLFNDAMSIGGVFDGGSTSFHFSGLINGTYEVYTDAAPPQGPEGELFIDVVGSNEGTLMTSGAMTGNTFELGVTHVIHTIDVEGGEFHIDLFRLPETPHGYVSGFQLVLIPAPPTISLLAAALLFGTRWRRSVSCPPVACCQHSLLTTDQV